MQPKDKEHLETANCKISSDRLNVRTEREEEKKAEEHTFEKM